jgi:hypothetical protein
MNRERAPLAQFFPNEKYSSVFEGGGVVVQENRAAFPRAFAVPEAIVADSAYEALDLLAHGAIQPRQQVVLETGEGVSFRSAQPNPLAGGDRVGAPYGEVEIVEYRNERVFIEAETAGGYLVLTDAYYPGWRAYVDGSETPVLRADYLFRAVELPPGAHQVEFRYEPTSFATGAQVARLALALASLALLATLVRCHSLRRSEPLRLP